MNLNEIKDLMAQFDQSSLKEFSYKMVRTSWSSVRMKRNLWQKQVQHLNL